MAFTAILRGVSPLDTAILFTVEISNGPNVLVPRNYAIEFAGKTLNQIKNELKTKVATDVTKYNDKESALTTMFSAIGSDVSTL